METRSFLRSKILSLGARARRLAKVDYASVGIRPQDLPYAPSPGHFKVANHRLALIDREIAKRLERVQAEAETASHKRLLIDIALVEREIDRARRTFGLFFEVFGQRGTSYAPVLAAHDLIAADCYQAIRQSSPGQFRDPVLKPITYMEHGYSPATLRRGIVLNRLLGEANPFPLIRIPFDRDNPWQSVFLHEVAHNLQAELGVWQENRSAVLRRVFRTAGDPLVTKIYAAWHKEVFADLAALLLSGPSAAWGMAGFLAHPAPKALTFRPGGAHPTGYLRMLIQAEMLRRMGFDADADNLTKVWKTLYKPEQGNRLPARLLSTAGHLIPELVDEIAFQPRRGMAHHSLADVIPFGQDDQDAILEASHRLVAGHPVRNLPPRFLVSASSYALETGRIGARTLSKLVVDHLTRGAVAPAPTIAEAQAAVAA
jgi:hypothetical protein